MALLRSGKMFEKKIKLRKRNMLKKAFAHSEWIHAASQHEFVYSS